MTEQVQCPNCGAYRVASAIKAIDPKTGQEESEPSFGGCIFIAISLFVGVVILVVVFDDLSSGAPIEEIGWGILMGAGAIAFAGLIFASMNAAYKRYSKNIKKYYYSCAICGYRWSRMENEPYPEVKIKPDLIAKGAQKLEEEAREAEEEQKKRDFIMLSRRSGK